MTLESQLQGNIYQRIKKSQPKLKYYDDFITHIFTRQTSNFVGHTGKRESGKTAGALLNCEILEGTRIKLFATNIKIIKSPIEFEFINDLETLKAWCLYNKSTYKMYVLDEVGKSAPRRHAMRSLNIKMVNELSLQRKYRLQNQYITMSQSTTESQFFNPVYIDGLFRRYNKDHQKEGYFIDYYGNLSRPLEDLPNTSIKFDTWDAAPFTEYPEKPTNIYKQEELRLLYEWAVNNRTAKDLGVHRMKIREYVKKFISTRLIEKASAVRLRERGIEPE